MPRPSNSGSTASTSTSPLADSPMQNPTIRDSHEHTQPLVLPAARLSATEAGVIPIPASRSREIAFSRVAALTSKSSSTSSARIARKRTAAPASVTLPQPLGRDPQRPVELARRVLPGDGRGQLHQRVVVVEAPQPGEEIVPDVAPAEGHAV